MSTSFLLQIKASCHIMRYKHVVFLSIKGINVIQTINKLHGIENTMQKTMHRVFRFKTIE